MMFSFDTARLTFRLKDLSTYRSELKGWSILWIMMLHFRFITVKPLGFIAQYGFAGVEIFIFVSGLGLYYSLLKHPSVGAFYLKRAKRIFPTYYLIGIIASLWLFHDTLLSYFFRYTTIGFWTEGLFFTWYIPSIVMLYLLTPVIFRWLLHHRIVAGSVCISIIILSYFVAKYQRLSGEHYFFLYRIPAFIGGMLCGKLIQEGGSSRTFLLLAVLGIPFFAVFLPLHHSIYMFKYYALFFLLPAFMVVICTGSKLLGRFNTVIRRIGEASLEIFLIQTLFFSAFCSGRFSVPDSWHDISTIALIIGCSVMGIALHQVMGRIKFLQ